MTRLLLAAVLALTSLTAGWIGRGPSTTAIASPASAHGGPALTVPARKLRAATECPAKARLRAARGVVLLVHGTGEKKEETWSWSYEPALRADGFATCAVQLPDHGLGDFAVAAEYVVVAIRKAARLAGGPIAVVGHSQGGALPVWVLKFWPDLPAKVTDVVSLAGPMNGTQLANELCTPGRCAPLTWQLRQGSAHVTALQQAPLPLGSRSPRSRRSTTKSCGPSPRRRDSPTPAT